jgi:hypothetical protein
MGCQGECLPESAIVLSETLHYVLVLKLLCKFFDQCTPVR